MKQFVWYDRRPDQTPVISDVDVTRFAEVVLRDYRPSLLERPGRLNPGHFIEHYLGASMEYQDIYYTRDQNPIAGATVFNTDHVMVFDRENMCVKEIFVEANTIILDNSTADPKNPGFGAFTMMHEAGHLHMHQDVYKRDNEQISFFDMGGFGQQEAGNAVLCKRSMLEQPKTMLVTDEDFREHQANTYAAAMLMPKATFIPLAMDLNYLAGFGSRIFSLPNKYDRKRHQELSGIIRRLADTYGVSYSAAEVQMRKYGLLTYQKDFQRAQTTLNKYLY